MLPSFVIVPVALRVTLSPSASPVIPASSFVSGVPSYALLAEPVVIVTAFLFTVSFPASVCTFVKLLVLSSPAAFLIMKPSATTFELSPASV